MKARQVIRDKTKKHDDRNRPTAAPNGETNASVPYPHMHAEQQQHAPNLGSLSFSFATSACQVVRSLKRKGGLLIARVLYVYPPRRGSCRCLLSRQPVNMTAFTENEAYAAKKKK